MPPRPIHPYVNLNSQPSTSIPQKFINPPYSIPPPTISNTLIQRTFLPPPNTQQQFTVPPPNFNQPPNYMPQIRPPNIRDTNICRLPTVHIRPQINSFYSSIGYMSPSQINSGISRLPNVTSEAVNWSLMVDAFVKKTTSGRSLLYISS